MPSTPEQIQAIREVLAECRAMADQDDALVQFNELRDTLLVPEVAEDVLNTAESLVHPMFLQPTPPPGAQAHMLILLSSLLQIRAKAVRERVDVLYQVWIRHPSSFGANRVTPEEFQRREFVDRMVDLLGWKRLDIVEDREALIRWCAWIHDWSDARKKAVKPALDQLRRHFPAPDLWWRIKV